MLFEFVHPRKNITEVPFYHLLPSEEEEVNEVHLVEFFQTLYERQEIWYKRNVLNLPKPWTKDQILSNYSFTNAYRELDRSSQYLIKNVLTDTSLSLEDLVFKIMVYRYFNKPDAFEDQIIYLPNYGMFSPLQLWQDVVSCRSSHYNPWHTAYMSNLVWATKFKPEIGMLKDWAYCRELFPKFHDEAVPTITKMLREGVEPKKIMKWLEKLPSISGFISHELFLDFCYIDKYNKYQINFDENSYTNVGPGASLGIRLIFPSLKPEEQEKAIYVLRDIAKDMLPEDFKYTSWDKKKREYIISNEFNMTLHNFEFWLCEFSKYKKMQWGLGKQRSKFVPKNSII